MINNINNANQYMISNTGLERSDVQNTIDKSKQVTADHFESNSAVQSISGSADPKNLQKIALWMPALIFTDGAVEKAMGGKQGEGILYKVADFGDKISNNLKLNSKGGKISSGIRKSRFAKYFTSDYAAVPKSNMPLEMVEKSSVKAGKNLREAFQGIIKNEQFIQNLKDSGIELSDKAKDVLFGSESVERSVKDLSAVADELAEKGIKTVSGQSKILPKKINISSINNKLKTAESRIGKTVLGNNLAKAAVKTKDILTMGGGLFGLFFVASALVNATKAAKEAPQDEKKSTFMHVMSEHLIGLALFDPCVKLFYKIGGNKYRGMSVEGRNALKNLVKTSNAGELTKEGYKIAQMQKKLLLNGVNKSEVEKLAGKSVEEASKLYKSLKNTGKLDLKFWEKPLKKAGKIIDAGLDTIKNPSGVGKIGNKIKGFGGGLMRFALIMFVLQPFIQKPVTKLIHKIFGEPKTYLEKEKAKDKKDEPVVSDNISETKPWTGLPADINTWPNKPVQSQPVLPQTPAQAQPVLSQTPVQQQPINNQQVNNIPGQPLNQPIASTPVADNSAVNAQNDEIAALGLFKKKDNDDNRYIPSITVDFSQQEKMQNRDTEKRVDAILKSTDAVMKNAQKYL